jgi:hypothetical protein
MEKLSSALAEARSDADRLCARLAEAAAREADHARRYSLVHQELADARAEIASLRDHLSRSEALRARLEGQMFEPGSGTDAGELIALRQETLVERQRAHVLERTAARLRTRVDELLTSRDTLFSRMAEWQRLVQTGNSDAVDLGEFIASLRQDIMVLENRNAEGDRQEKTLRELLARAGVDAGKPPAEETEVAASPRSEPEVKAAAPNPYTFEGLLNTPRQADAELDLWETDGEPHAAEESLAETPSEETPSEVVAADTPAWIESDDTLVVAIESELEPEAEPIFAVAFAGSESGPGDESSGSLAQGVFADDPVVRAASYGRLNRDLEDRPSLLADQLRSGLSDVDPRVRRRAVLAAATARNVELRPLLEPLREDPDPQVRRVVREVLRYAPAVEQHTHDSVELD